MAQLPGHWGEPTITGTRMLVVADREFKIPADALVKLVNPKGKHPVAHVLADGRVRVLSGLGELQESDRLAIARARKADWYAVGGDVV